MEEGERGRGEEVRVGEEKRESSEWVRRDWLEEGGRNEMEEGRANEYVLLSLYHIPLPITSPLRKE